MNLTSPRPSTLRASSPSSEGARRPPGVGWQAAAGALMVGGPVWHYLHVHHYRFGDPGALLVPALAAALGAIGGIASRRFPGRWAILPFAALAFGFIDLQFEFEEAVYTVAVAGAALIVVAALGDQREKVVVMALAAFYLGSIPQGPPTSARLAAGVGPPPNRSQPFLLHLILDAQWGVGGQRAAGDTATADWLADFYQDRGFRIYSGAYSRTYLTRFSIAETFSLGAPVGIAEPGKTEYRLKDNPYFTELGRLGYRVRVVQSTYLDVCPDRHPAVESCVSAPWRSMAYLGYLEGSWGARTAMVARFILNANSHVYRRTGIEKDGGPWRQSFAGRAAADIDSLAREIRQQAAPGIAVVAHLVFPHGPFELDEHCLMHTDPARRLGEIPPSKVAVDDRWPERLAAYNRQMRCAQDKVAKLIAAVDSSVGAANAIVVVQGDHGARIAQHPVPRTQALATFSVEQLNAAFSTLFAIRAPGVTAGVEDEAVPVQQWFWKFVADGFRAPDPIAWGHYVRRPPTKNVAGDTLRMLAEDELVWAKSREPRRPIF
jgi:hypothetical protein